MKQLFKILSARIKVIYFKRFKVMSKLHLPQHYSYPKRSNLYSSEMVLVIRTVSRSSNGIVPSSPQILDIYFLNIPFYY